MRLEGSGRGRRNAKRLRKIMTIALERRDKFES